MDIDPSMFRVDSIERLEAELSQRSTDLCRDENITTLGNLFQVVEGHAEHLIHGMVDAGFDESEAETQAWRAAWKKHRQVLDIDRTDTMIIAGIIERSLGFVNPKAATSDTGEPLDAPTREFYRAFVECLEYSSVRQTALWLFEDD